MPDEYFYIGSITFIKPCAWNNLLCPPYAICLHHIPCMKSVKWFIHLMPQNVLSDKKTSYERPKCSVKHYAYQEVPPDSIYFSNEHYIWNNKPFIGPMQNPTPPQLCYCISALTLTDQRHHFAEKNCNYFAPVEITMTWARIGETSTSSLHFLPLTCKGQRWETYPLAELHENSSPAGRTSFQTAIESNLNI